jgi:hypothetical protein
MARCPAHGNRIQMNSSGAVNLFGATPQPDCRWILACCQSPRTSRKPPCRTLVQDVEISQVVIVLGEEINDRYQT